MKKGYKQERKMKGVALIVVIGVLSLLVIIGTYFAVNMQLEQKAAANYLNSVKAKYLAELGIQKTVADIRNHVKTDSYSTLINYITNYSIAEQEISGIGTYQIFIGTDDTGIGNIGEDGKINLNILSDTDYLWIDDLRTKGLTYDEIAKIIDYCDADSNNITELLTSGGPVSASGDEGTAKNLPFTTLEEIKLIIGDSKYNSIKDYVTIYAPITRGGLIGDYYGNITSFSSSTIFDLDYYKGKIIELGKFKSIILPGSDGGTGAPTDERGRAESNDCYFAGGYLLNVPGEFQLNYFGVKWKGYIYIPFAKAGSSIKFSVNSDDGIKLYIDGSLILSDWRDRGFDESAATGSYLAESSGWHPIMIEYYENEDKSAIDIKWDGLGALDYVPAEYFGYSVPSYLGPYPPTTATETTHNCAGNYKIISIGKVGKVTSGEVDDGDILSEKKISAVVKIFGTWTQVTRGEFYAAWYSDYNDYSDGEILNVTWLDNCPLDAGPNPNTGVQPNALKLGFWDDFDEDVGYSAVNLVGDGYTHWGYFGDHDGADGDNEFSINADEGERITVEINAYFYYTDSRTGYDLFTEAWEKDEDSPEEREATAWDVAWFYPKRKSLFESAGPYPDQPAFIGDSSIRDYYTLLKLDWAPAYLATKGISELTLSTSFAPLRSSQVDHSYSKDKVLGITGIGETYKAYINGSPTGAIKDEPDEVPAGCVAMCSYNVDFASGYPDHLISPFYTYWDDIRIIPAGGFFVSTPFYESSNVDWGYVSWNESGTGGSISVEVRTSNPTTDDDWTSASSGQALNLDEAQWFQYKVTMTNATCDGTTPVFEDITITYLPEAEILYWREEVE